MTEEEALAIMPETGEMTEEEALAVMPETPTQEEKVMTEEEALAVMPETAAPKVERQAVGTPPISGDDEKLKAEMPTFKDSLIKAEEKRAQLLQKIKENKEDRAAGRPPRHDYGVLQASWDTIKRLGQTESTQPFREKAALEGEKDWSLLQGLGTAVGKFGGYLGAEYDFLKEAITGNAAKAAKRYGMREKDLPEITFSVENRLEKELAEPLVKLDGTVNIDGVLKADLPRAVQNKLLALSIEQKTGVPSAIWEKQIASRFGALDVNSTALKTGAQKVAQLIDAIPMNIPSWLYTKALGTEKDLELGMEDALKGNIAKLPVVVKDPESVGVNAPRYLGEGLWKLPTRRAPVFVDEQMPEKEVSKILWKEMMKDYAAEAQNGAFENWAQIASMLVPAAGEAGVAAKAATVGKEAAAVGKVAQAARVLEAAGNPLTAPLAGIVSRHIPQTGTQMAAQQLGHLAIDTLGITGTSALTAPGGFEQKMDAALGAGLISVGAGLPFRAAAMTSGSRLIRDRKLTNELLNAKSEKELSRYTRQQLKKAGITFDEAKVHPENLESIKRSVAQEIAQPGFEDAHYGQIVDSVSRLPEFRNAVDAFDKVLTSREGAVHGLTAEGRVNVEAVERADHALRLDYAKKLKEGQIDKADFDQIVETLEDVKSLPEGYYNDKDLFFKKLEEHPIVGPRIGDEIQHGLVNLDNRYKMRAIEFIRALVLSKGSESGPTLFRQALHKIQSPDEAMKTLRKIMDRSDETAEVNGNIFDATNPSSTVAKAIDSGELLELAKAIRDVGQEEFHGGWAQQKAARLMELQKELQVARETMKQNQPFAKTEVNPEVIKQQIDARHTMFEEVQKDIDAVAHGLSPDIAQPLRNRDLAELQRLAADPRYLDSKADLKRGIGLVRKETNIINNVIMLSDQLDQMKKDPNIGRLLYEAVEATPVTGTSEANLKEMLIHSMSSTKRAALFERVNPQTLNAINRLRKDELAKFVSPGLTRILEAIEDNIRTNEKANGFPSVDPWLIKTLRLWDTPDIQGERRPYDPRSFSKAVLMLARDLWDMNTEWVKAKHAYDVLSSKIDSERSVMHSIDAISDLKEFSQKTGTSFINFERKIDEITSRIVAGKHVNRNQVKFLVDMCSTEIGRKLDPRYKVTNKAEAQRIVAMLAGTEPKVYNMAKDAVSKITGITPDDVALQAVLSRLLTYSNDYGGSGWLAFSLNAASDAKPREGHLVAWMGSQEFRANLLSKKTGTAVANTVSNIAYARSKAESIASKIISRSVDKLHSLEINKTSYLAVQTDKKFVHIFKRMYSEYQGAPKNTFYSNGEFTPEGKLLDEFVESSYLEDSHANGNSFDEFLKTKNLTEEERISARAYLSYMVGDVAPKEYYQLAIEASRILIEGQKEALERGNSLLAEAWKSTGTYTKPYEIDANYRVGISKDSTRVLFDHELDATEVLDRELAKNRVFKQDRTVTLDTAAHPEAAFQSFAYKVVEDATIQPHIEELRYLIEINGGKGSVFDYEVRQLLFSKVNARITEVGFALANHATLRTIKPIFGGVLNPTATLMKLPYTAVVNPLQTAVVSVTVSPSLTAKFLRDYSVLAVGLDKLIPEEFLKAAGIMATNPSPEYARRVNEMAGILSGATNLPYRERTKLNLVRWETDFPTYKQGVHKVQMAADTMNEGFAHLFKERYEEKMYLALLTQAANIFENARSIAEVNMGKMDDATLVGKVYDELRPAIRDKAQADVYDVAQRIVDAEKRERGAGIEVFERYGLSLIQSHQGRYDKDNVCSWIRNLQAIVPGAFMFANATLVGTYRMIERIGDFYTGHGISSEAALWAGYGMMSLALMGLAAQPLAEEVGVPSIAKIGPFGWLGALGGTLGRSGDPSRALQAAKGALEVSPESMAVGVYVRTVGDLISYLSIDKTKAEGRQEAKDKEAKIIGRLLKLVPAISTLEGPDWWVGNMGDFAAKLWAGWEGEVVHDQATAISREYYRLGKELPRLSPEEAYSVYLLMAAVKTSNAKDIGGFPIEQIARVAQQMSTGETIFQGTDDAIAKAMPAYAEWMRRNKFLPRGVGKDPTLEIEKLKREEKAKKFYYTGKE